MKQVLFLIHGMGESAPAPLGDGGDRQAWAKDVISAIRAAAAAYPAISLSDLELVPIVYDDVFQRHAKTWADLADQLDKTGLRALVSFMKGADDGKFLWGSLVDVIQYRALTAVRTNVITHVASQIADTVKKFGTGDNAKYHVLCHSLGTAVAHDAMQKLATVGIDGNTALQPPGFRFDTLMALANVSRLLWATDENFYDETRVRPPDCGLATDRCAVQCYLSVRHVADPIPSVVRFRRKTWSPDNYLSIDIRHVRDINVHAFTHYLQAPMVVDTLLYRLFGGVAVPRVAMLKRLQAFKDYEGPKADSLAVIVQTVEAALDKLSAQSEGKFEFDIDEIARALWDYRSAIGDVLAGV